MHCRILYKNDGEYRVTKHPVVYNGINVNIRINENLKTLEILNVETNEVLYSKVLLSVQNLYRKARKLIQKNATFKDSLIVEKRKKAKFLNFYKREIE